MGSLIRSREESRLLSTDSADGPARAANDGGAHRERDFGIRERPFELGLNLRIGRIGWCNQVSGKERQHVLLDSLTDLVRVITVVLFVIVWNAQLRQRRMQLLVRREQRILRADLNTNRVVLAKVRHVLLEHLERR